MRPLASVAVLALALACAGSTPPPSRPAPRPSPLIGEPLDVTALDMAGQQVRIDAGRGRVLVVDFFASWCEPCREQLPQLDRLARELGGRGLAVYGVSFDDTEEAIRGFLGEVPVGFPVLWDPGGDRLARALSIQRLPTTFLVDRRGNIRNVHLGYSLEESARLEAEIRAAVEEPVPVPVTGQAPR